MINKEQLIGLEVEFHLMDKDGNITDNADDILNDKDASPYTLNELTHSIEFISINKLCYLI